VASILSRNMLQEKDARLAKNRLRALPALSPKVPSPRSPLLGIWEKRYFPDTDNPVYRELAFSRGVNGSALVVNPLCRWQERRTMRKSEAQVGNSPFRIQE
jgi:hypothetical protein